MRRREFITLLGGAAISWPPAVQAQHAGKVWRIGHATVSGGSEYRTRALEQNLADIGYVHGQNISLLHQVMPPQSKIREEIIANLVRNIDLLVVWSTVGAVAAKRVVPAMPTVFLAVSDPVGIGLVQSLTRPGGNMTPDFPGG
jgi:ABC transporter substrate binding protein